MKAHQLGFLGFSIPDRYYQRMTTSKSMLSSDADLLMKERSRTESKVFDVGFGEQLQSDLEIEYRRFGVWIGVFWTQYIARWPCKLVIIALSVCWFTISLTYTMQIELLELPEEYFGADTFLMRSSHASNKFTPSSGNKNKIDISFGIKGMVPGSRNVWSESGLDLGDIEQYDLEVHRASQQLYLAQYATRLRAFYSESHNERIIDLDEDCENVFEAFYTFVNASGRSTPLIFSSDDAVQKQAFLGELHDWYYNNDEAAALSARNNLRLEITGEAGAYEMTFVNMHVISHYAFLNAQTDADRDLNNLEDWIAAEREVCLSWIGSSGSCSRSR